ncbi:hypothetical protein TNCV_3509951 [Trichonephila clavipes]|nr:hypothetical protein TNCV_3509951 [Trichonephila clavipes]
MEDKIQIPRKTSLEKRNLGKSFVQSRKENDALGPVNPCLKKSLGFVIMGDFTDSEKADIHLICNAANGNGRAALWLYQESIPNRQMPNHKMLQRLQGLR